jgi:hypothetical protein
LGIVQNRLSKSYISKAVLVRDYSLVLVEFQTAG